MATHFDNNINITDQFKTTDLVINGKVEDMVSTSVLDDAGVKIVQSTYKVLINELISGNFKKKSLKVTIVGGLVEGHKTEKTVPLEKGENYLMLLGKDYGPNKEKDEFVPMFCNCFRIDEKGHVECPQKIREELIENKITKNQKHLTIKPLVGGIKEILKNKLESSKVSMAQESEEMKADFVEESSFEMPGEDENLPREGKIGNH